MRRGTAFSALLLLCTSLFASSLPAAAGPALLFDVSNGRVLYAEDADNQWYPASLTKLMTAYLVFEEIKAGRLSLKQKISCSAAANAEPPSKIGLPVGGQITVDLALQALFVKSANDVAVMLAETIAGSESAFVERMNATAKRLGMSRTTFANANGLPSIDQITTARDLARLSRAIVTEFPEYARYWSMPQMRYGKQHLVSHNPLLRSVEGADGLKTGFTCDSGFNIIASATRDGRQIVAVVLGDKTSNERNVRASSLLEYGFQQLDHGNAATLDSMPLAPTADGVKSVRADVESWGCNPQKHLAKHRHKHRREAKNAAKAKAAAVTANKPAGNAAGDAASSDGTAAASDSTGSLPPAASAEASSASAASGLGFKTTTDAAQ
jgi:D-alanyl-D-alanine carboxypeptidase